MDDQTGTQIYFDNPSDALFARLFLKEDGVPWTFFDTILETVRSPAFNPSQITLKDYGGVLAHIAETREKKLEAIVERRFRSGGVYATSMGVPDVVRDALFEILREELRYASSVLRRHMHGCALDFPEYRAWEILEDALAITAICCRVHSSWLMGARKVLGYEHQIGSGKASPSLSDSMRNPWIGSHTRKLCVNLVHESDEPPLIRPLFTRLNNIRRLVLDFQQEPKPFEELSLVHICAALTLLPTVEEIVFCVHNLHEAPIQALSKITLPMLKIVRLAVNSMIDFFPPDELPTSLLPLRVVQSLRLIHIYSSYPSFLKGVSWSKSVDNSQVLNVDELFINSVNAKAGDLWFKSWIESWAKEGKETPTTMLRFARRIHYNHLWNSNAVLPALVSMSTSLLWLGITSDLGLPGGTRMFDTLNCMPSSLEGMLLSLPSADAKIDLLDLDLWDFQVASALSAGMCPNLREMEIWSAVRRETNPHIHIADNRHLSRRNPAQLETVVMNESGVENTGDEEGLSPLLPRCEEECRKRGIRFVAVAM